MTKTTKLTSFQTIKKFLAPIKNSPKEYSWLIFMAIYSSVIMVFFANLIKWISDFISKKDVESIYRYGVYYAILVIVFQVLQWIFRSNDRIVSYKTNIFLRAEYFKKMIKMDNNLYETNGTGKLIGIGSNGVITWSEMLGDITTVGVQRFMTTILGLVSVALIGWQYFLLVLGFIIASAIAFFALRKPIQSCRNERRSLWGELGRQESKIVMSKFEILQQDRIIQETHKFQKILEKETLISQRQDIVQYPFDRGTKALIDIFRIGIIFFVGAGAVYGKYSVGDFAAFMVLLTIIDGSVAEFMRMFIRMFDSFLRVEKLWETFDESPKIKGYEEGADFEFKKGDIEFSNVAFKYEGGTQVFDDFSLKIKGSKKTAFVGPSGCGKSTIIKLIAGYIHANNGTISVDEQILPGGTFQNKLTSVNLKSYYPHIGYLTQESSVFDGTVFENLIYGLSDKDVLAEIMKLRVADPEGLRHHPLLSQVISQAKCEFIYNFPDGLGTEIGEKGVKLSGGQKQRLAIAKIFLKNPDIILLDEPTSALDSFSEEEVGKALDNLFKNRTVIVVAHRLQTVKQADEIIVLKEGKIAERGRHKELVASGGIYAKMLELQSGF